MGGEVGGVGVDRRIGVRFEGGRRVQYEKAERLMKECMGKP